MADKFLPNISETTEIFKEKTPLPSFLSPEQIKVYTQLIKDNPDPLMRKSFSSFDNLDLFISSLILLINPTSKSGLGITISIFSLVIISYTRLIYSSLPALGA